MGSSTSVSGLARECGTGASIISPHGLSTVSVIAPCNLRLKALQIPNDLHRGKCPERINAIDSAYSRHV